ncbi:BolA family transcriptional regulator [Gammaproteobacteria bacterium]|nr:BolA family transcriptional regulator [Gammaproteobacteria bacterium]
MLNIIEDRMNSAFNPTYIQVLDDSKYHVGHEGAKNGAGHYTVKINSECFEKLSRIEAHKKIYDVMKDLMPHKIHALCLVINK